MNDEANELGKRLVRVIVIAAAFVIGMMVWGHVRADMMLFDRKGNSLLLHEGKPCADGKVLALILAQVAPRYQKSWQAGVMVYDGRTINACWFDGGPIYFVLDEDGDRSEYPREAFKRATGV